MKMIKINNKIKKKIIIVLLTCFGIILILAFLEISNITNFLKSKTGPTPEQIEQEKKTNLKNKQEYLEGNSKKSTYSGSSTPIAPTSTDITMTTKREVNGSVTISTQLKNYSGGTCNLSIISNGNVYSKSAPVLYQTSFSTCAGFNISTSSVGLGTWDITLNVTNNGVTNTSTTTMEVL